MSSSSQHLLLTSFSAFRGRKAPTVCSFPNSPSTENLKTAHHHHLNLVHHQCRSFRKLSLSNHWKLWLYPTKKTNNLGVPPFSWLQAIPHSPQQLPHVSHTLLYIFVKDKSQIVLARRISQSFPFSALIWGVLPSLTALPAHKTQCKAPRDHCCSFSLLKMVKCLLSPLLTNPWSRALWQEGFQYKILSKAFLLPQS